MAFFDLVHQEKTVVLKNAGRGTASMSFYNPYHCSLRHGAAFRPRWPVKDLDIRSRPRTCGFSTVGSD